MTVTGSSAENLQVAVLGAGIMGTAMARNLIAAGLRTTVWDRSPAATVPLSEAGALVAASPPGAVRDAQVVITMLPTADVVTSVIFAGGVTEAFAPGAVWAQMGTIGPAGTTAAVSRLGQLRPDVSNVLKERQSPRHIEPIVCGARIEGSHCACRRRIHDFGVLGR